MTNLPIPIHWLPSIGLILHPALLLCPLWQHWTSPSLLSLPQVLCTSPAMAFVLLSLSPHSQFDLVTRTARWELQELHPSARVPRLPWVPEEGRAGAATRASCRAGAGPGPRAGPPPRGRVTKPAEVAAAQQDGQLLGQQGPRSSREST